MGSIFSSIDTAVDKLIGPSEGMVGPGQAGNPRLKPRGQIMSDDRGYYRPETWWRTENPHGSGRFITSGSIEPARKFVSARSPANSVRISTFDLAASRARLDPNPFVTGEFPINRYTLGMRRTQPRPGQTLSVSSSEVEKPWNGTVTSQDEHALESALIAYDLGPRLSQPLSEYDGPEYEGAGKPFKVGGMI